MPYLKSLILREFITRDLFNLYFNKLLQHNVASRPMFIVSLWRTPCHRGKCLNSTKPIKIDLICGKSHKLLKSCINLKVWKLSVHSYSKLQLKLRKICQSCIILSKVSEQISRSFRSLNKVKQSHKLRSMISWSMMLHVSMIPGVKGLGDVKENGTKVKMV